MFFKHNFVLNTLVNSNTLNHAPMPAVTEPTNYTRLSKKITHRVDDLANLSPYNPVVHEITTDFKPTYIPAKIVISLNIVITNQVQIKVAEVFSSNHTHSHRVQNKVPVRIIFQQKHQTRRREWPLPMVLSFSHRRIKAVDTVAVIHLPICNKWEQSPKYEKVLS
jgi:hypothetical protein